MSPADPGHAPIMPTEIRSALAIRPGGTVLDCTAGRGGHAALLATDAGPTGTMVLCDLDPENLAFAAERVSATGTVAEELRARLMRLEAREEVQAVEAPPGAEPQFLINHASQVVHRITIGDLALPASEWRTACGFPFGLTATECVRTHEVPQEAARLCRSCLPLSRQAAKSGPDRASKVGDRQFFATP